MSGLPKKRCSKANDDSNPAEETVKGGACRKNRLRSLSDRVPENQPGGDGRGQKVFVCLHRYSARWLEATAERV